MADQVRSLVDANEVAQRLGMGKWAVYDLAKRGTLPHVRIGRRVRFDPAQIETWIANGGKSHEEAAA